MTRAPMLAVALLVVSAGCARVTVAKTTAPPAPPSSAAPVRREGHTTKRAHHKKTATKHKATHARASWSLVTEPDDGMGRIYSLMSSADHSLDMTMYELSDARAESILESDASRGVTVRVILDRDYEGVSVNQAAYSALAAHGVEVHWAPADTIFHQKTITVDGDTSAIMTLNLTSRYYATSRDFAVITTDRADVAAIESVFGQDWSTSTALGPGPAGANLVWSPGASWSLVALIASARHRLLVENEEMDDNEIAQALEAAAERGVTVEVVMTYSSTWASELEELASSGVKVRTYPAGGSLYIHAKVIVADGTKAFVGSQNFSESSLDYNRELGLITTDRSLVGPIAATLGSDFAGASRLPTQPTGSSGVATTAPPAATGAWCQASASPADDGYSGDFDVHVTSNQPYRTATASHAGDTYSYETDSTGYADIYLWDTSAGEEITVTVGGATCTTTAA